MDFLKDLDDFVYRIEKALFAASLHHTKNELILKRSNLKIQYHNSLAILFRQ